MEPVPLILLGAYASLLLELTVFPIPSEASTLQLLHEGAEAAPDVDADALSRARELSLPAKLIRYVLPTAFGVLCFLIPPALVFWPKIAAWFVPLGPQGSGTLAVSGILVVLCGRILTLSSVLQLRRERRPGIHGFQPRGLFLKSRNPGLLGMYLFYFGNCAIYPGAILILGLFPYLLNMHQKVLLEESRLRGLHGRSYDEYKERVPRYLFRF